MPNSFFQYEMMPTTWFYVSALIILASFFNFRRFWSIRNFDLLGLILITPGLIFLAMQDTRHGYIWLFVVGFLLCIRLIADNFMFRRPLLEPNLSSGGLAFSCFCLVFFIIAALTINRSNNIDTIRTLRLEQILTSRHIHEKKGIDPLTHTISPEAWDDMPPGFRPFLYLTEQTNLAFMPPKKVQQEIIQSVEQKEKELKVKEGEKEKTVSAKTIPDSAVVVTPVGANDTAPVIENDPNIVITTQTEITAPGDTVTDERENTAQSPIEAVFAQTKLPEVSFFPIPLPLVFVIVIHLAIVLGFLFAGHLHFGSVQTGIACATLYLLHPYCNQMVGRLDHILPAALILWAIVLYPRPFFAGLCIGTAAALVWYPILLLPLWCGFYLHRGCFRFISGTVISVGAFAALLLFSPESLGTLSAQLTHFLGKTALFIFSQPDGFWQPGEIYYRVPILALFGVVCIGLFLYPSYKHLATLMSCSALLMLGIQFWQIYEGGIYIAWYLPLLILTVFRPNLDDRTARNAVM